jgi:hypothetical protein
MCDRLNVVRSASLAICHIIYQAFFCVQDGTRVSVYDPVFTAEDLSLFGALQIRVLTENRAGLKAFCPENANTHVGLPSSLQNAGYGLECPTICFMPHCDMELYENILKANWSPEKLSNLLFVSNRLLDYIDRWLPIFDSAGISCDELL